MKQLNKIILVATLMVMACGKKEEGDKKTQLEALKKQKETIEVQIKDLETAISKEGGVVVPVDANIKTVKVEPVALQTFTHFVEIQGKVDTDKNILVSSEANGNLLNVFANRGDLVKKGQVLASVDPTLLNKAIEEVKTSQELVNTLFEKQEKLWKENIGTEVQYLQAKSNKESLDAKMASLKEQLRKTKILAPIAGSIDEVFKKDGEIVAAGMPVVRLVSYSEFKIMGELAESYVSKVNIGDDVQLYFPDIDKTITDKIDAVGSTINALNRTFTVEIRLPADKINIKPNMICYLKIKDYSKSKAVVVPINTVQKSANGSYVYIAENGKTLRKEVKVAYTYGNDALISEGLNAGDKIITFGYSDLTNGQSIKY
jgi:membrane fusion protein, multidrug efflux system